MGQEVRESMLVPGGEGHAFIVPEGGYVRFRQGEDGPSAIDFNSFSLADPREHFWAGRTRMFERMHPTRGTKLWSTEPMMRPMFIITEDTMESQTSANGARYHDLTMPRCSPRYVKLRYNEPNRKNCHNNMGEAIRKFGISADLVHDTLNLFGCTRWDPESDRIVPEAIQATASDYVTMQAQFDCIVAVSACPGRISPINDIRIELLEDAAVV